MPEFKAELSVFKKALELCAKTHLSDFPFLKLIGDRSQTHILDSRNFPHFTAAAFAIASIDNPQYQNDEMSEFKERVKAFIIMAERLEKLKL